VIYADITEKEVVLLTPLMLGSWQLFMSVHSAQHGEDTTEAECRILQEWNVQSSHKHLKMILKCSWPFHQGTEILNTTTTHPTTTHTPLLHIHTSD